MKVKKTKSENDMGRPGGRRKVRKTKRKECSNG